MHKKLVFFIVARIGLIVSAMMIFPLAWALYFHPGHQEVFAFMLSMAIGLGLSLIVLLLFRPLPKNFERLNTKDALSIVGLSWIGLSALGALPFLFSGFFESYTDCFFETVSGFTTTGASILRDVEVLPQGILFWRSMTHWLGGMGVIVLALALLPALGNNAFQLYSAEAPGVVAERLQPKIKETAKILWGVYFLLTGMQVVLLMAGDMPLFDALCHAFGTMATGGFSTKNASIAAYGPYVQWVVAIFMFLAGANFMLHYYALRGKVLIYFENEEFRWYVAIVFLASVGATVVLCKFIPLAASIRDAVFQVLAVMTTTGYVTADFDAWPHVLRFGLLVLMFVGGCGGSTGGGIKVSRGLLCVKAAARSIVQAVSPNSVICIRSEGVSVSDRMTTAVLSYFVIYVLLWSAGGFFLTLSESCDLVTAFSASIAALSNIGPGLAKVGAMQNYAWISAQGKWALMFLMLAGRLELYSILILFSPVTWRK